MKKRHIGLLLLGFATAINLKVLPAQDQALYFNGTNQYAQFTAPDNMPSGKVDRTVEFWMKSDLHTGAIDNREHIIELGTQGETGSAFGIFTSVQLDGTTQLGFWGSYADLYAIGEIPDDQWHFVAITYREPYITCYIDGEFKTTTDIKLVSAGNKATLNTKIKDKTCYIGGFPDRGWYYKGAIDNVSIWNNVRSQAEIKLDMVDWPKRKGNESNLVVAFNFNEGVGNSFQNLTKTVSGKLQKGNLWTKPISFNPDPFDDGIWFVIQNKERVDTDFAYPAEAMGLTINDSKEIVLKSIPLAYTDDYSGYLWRAVKINDKNGFTGRYKLINKKLDDANALTAGPGTFSVISYVEGANQKWNIQNSNKAEHGTNAYTLTNDELTAQKSLAYNHAGQSISVADKNTADTKQVWLFVPMKLVGGYHIPALESKSYQDESVRNCNKTDCSNCNGDLDLRATSVHPFVKKLCVNDKFSIFASNTTSDWAILNTHLIYKNIVNSFLSHPPYAKTPANQVMLISKYDTPEIAYQYPNVYNNKDWLADTRGYAGSRDDVKNGKPTTSVLTEEMMCRTGKIVNRPADQGKREFEQVVHEFGHTINYVYFLDKDFDADIELNPFYKDYLAAKEKMEKLQSSASGTQQHNSELQAATDSYNSANQNKGEWFPWTLQKRFNNSDGNKNVQLNENEKKAMDKIITPLNTWLPPRRLRELEP